MTITARRVQSALDRVTAQVSGLAPLMPQIGGLPLDGAITIDISDDGRLMLVGHERGRKTVRYSTRDVDDLVHQATLEAVWGMALDWELHNRGRFPDYEDDTRVTWLAKEIEVMRRIDPRWAEELRSAIPERCPGVSVPRVDAHPVLSS